MGSSTSAVPRGLGTLTPCLVVHECGKAVDFYVRAFGAHEVARIFGTDGRHVTRAELTIGDCALMVTEATHQSPPTSTLLMIYVEDCEQAYRQALDAGAKPLMAPMDMFHGARAGQVADPFGQRWMLATQVEDVSSAELAERARAAMLDSATSD
jgi:PhnB protein